jgi:hypothetical protein
VATSTTASQRPRDEDAQEQVDAQWSARVTRRFLITFAILAAVFLLPWPRWGRVMSRVFAGYGNLVVGILDIGGDRAPRFVSPTEAERQQPDVGEWAVLLTSGGDENGSQSTPLDTRIIAYTPFAIFAALVLATRTDRRRKLKIAAVGGAALLARLAAAVALPVARSLGPPYPFWASGPAAEALWYAFITPPAMSYVTAALCWWISLALTAPTTRARELANKGRRGDRKVARRGPKRRLHPG